MQKVIFMAKCDIQNNIYRSTSNLTQKNAAILRNLTSPTKSKSKSIC